ncbi:MAG: DUF5960 family protein [Enterococcus sp.]
MDKEYFEQQEAFMKDYQKVAKDPLPLDKIADLVIRELNRTQEDTFTLSMDDSLDGKMHQYPFSRRVYADENDGTLNTMYTYEGEPYILETDE